MRLRCLNDCPSCVLGTIGPTAKERRKRRVRRLWWLIRGFPALCTDVLRAIVIEWFLESSPAFTTFTLRCAVHAYLHTPFHSTVLSWGPIRYWDTRDVTHFDALFQNAWEFNERLSWDTRNAESMIDMFSCAYHFNQPVDFRFDKVRSTVGMFAQALRFNQPITVHHAPHWQTARWMFFAASSMNANVFCNAPNLREVTAMFYRANAFRATVVMTNDRVIVHRMNLPTGVRVRAGDRWYQIVNTVVTS